MIIAMTQYGGGNRQLPKYTVHSGTAPLLLVDPNNDSYWELVFLGNCEITFSRLLTNVDVFVCAGGMPGGSGTGYWGNYNDCEAKGGKGGNGGGTVTTTAITLQEGIRYAVRVGGSGQPSSAFGATAETGTGANGGSGAYSAWKGSIVRNYDGDAGGDGTVAFGSGETLYQNGRKYGPAGGGGSARSSLNDNQQAKGAGGETGGGDGGDDSNGLPGTANTGAGGGGGSSCQRLNKTEGAYNKLGGDGGSGIVIIRNAR